jgi:hypothetical protein
MIKGIIGSVSLCILIAISWHQARASEAPQHASGDVKVIVKRIEHVSDKETHFRLSVINESASTVFLEGGAAEISSKEPVFEKLFLEQWKDGGWRLVVPCLENAPSSIIRLNPGKTVNQDRVLTDPVRSACREGHIQFKGRFRFKLEYFQSEQEAKANERQFDLSGVSSPAPHVVASDSFEIPAR